MLIAIEAQRIFRQHKHGMDVVALELIRRLQRLDAGNEYVLFAAPGPDKNCVQPSGCLSVQTISGFTYAGWEQFSLPSVLKKLRPDFLHCTANTAPLNCPVPLVLTLHDIIYLEEMNFQGSSYQNLGNIYRRFVVPRVIKNAKKIITVSQYEKSVILEKCRVTEGRVEVIYNAVDKRFNNNYRSEEIKAFSNQHNLPENFILLLGNTAPKKNTAGAIRAYQYYCTISKDPLPLVVVDYKGRQSDKRIIYPGYVPPDKMPILYNCASLFLYPSLRESFGLPVLEAMACGIPVITSNTSAIPEIAGDAAELVDPFNHKQIGEAIYKLLSDESLRHSYKQKGLARASRFSWENSANQLLQLYSSMLR
jgi:glycosyltransferase involved in cell wall biosynthesis